MDDDDADDTMVGDRDEDADGADDDADDTAAALKGWGGAATDDECVVVG